MIAPVALALRFACELAAIAAFLWWGFSGSVARAVLGVVLAALVVALWTAFVAPKAPRRLRDPLRAALELVIFAAATIAFVAVDEPVVAGVFAAAAVATTAAVRVWPEPVSP